MPKYIVNYEPPRPKKSLEFVITADNKKEVRSKMRALGIKFLPGETETVDGSPYWIEQWSDIPEDMEGMTTYEDLISHRSKSVTAKKSSKRKNPRGVTPWIAHVKATQKKCGCAYGEAMKIAARTYRKK